MTTTTEHPKRAYKAHRARQIAYGRWEPYVDATPVREHVQTLMAYGLTHYAIARLAGVSQCAVAELMGGTPYRGRGPNTRVLKKTARALMAPRFDLDALPDAAFIDPSGTRRRLQALAAIGYSIPAQAARMGRAATNVYRLMSQQSVTVASARQVRDLYDELSMRPPEETPYVRRARNGAARHGWLPPLAWDDDLIDLPDSLLAVELRRRVAGMDTAELARCYRYARDHGERSPLVVAGAEEYKRRRRASRRVA